MRTSKPSVLVVDPDPQVRKMLAVTLSASQFKVIEAETAPEALRLAGLYQPEQTIEEVPAQGTCLVASVQDLFSTYCFCIQMSFHPPVG